MRPIIPSPIHQQVPAIWIDPVTGEQTSPLQQGVWKEMPEEEFTAVFTASMTSGGFAAGAQEADAWVDGWVGGWVGRWMGGWMD